MFLNHLRCVTLLVLVWALVSCHQHDAEADAAAAAAQPTNKKIMKAIRHLEQGIEVFEDKLLKHLEKIIMPVHERFNIIEETLRQIKQDIYEEFEDLKIKTGQCQGDGTLEQHCKDDCVCRNGDIFCPNAHHITAVLPSDTGIDASELKMYKAAEKGNLDYVKKAIASEIDVNWHDSDGWTALHATVDSNNTDVAKALVDAGADVDQQNEEGLTPLHAAAMTGKTELVKSFIALGADVNIATNYGKTPLISSAAAGFVNTTEALLDSNASLGKADISGSTALHWAALNNKGYIVELLLQAGADPLIRNKQRYTPADSARSQGHDELADIIEGYY